MRIRGAIWLAVVLVAAVAEAAPRKWTSADGKFSVQAELVGMSEGKVELRKLNGDVVRVPMERLSEADREWAKKAFPDSAGAASAGASVVGLPGTINCVLELKTIELPKGAGSMRSAMGPVGRLCVPQHFFLEVSSNASNTRAPYENPNFKRVVKKEPAKYQSRHPFRGVAQINQHEHGFVFDAASPSSPAYDRLYFDLNANGDLTDDRPINGEIRGERGSTTAAFPRVELSLDVGGVKMKYAFFMSVFCRDSGNFAYASASLMPAVYREGWLSMGGRKRHIVLLDANSNGCFCDHAKVFPGSGAHLPTMGDMLLIDPESGAAAARGPVEGKYYVSKVLSIEGKFYDCQISPSGDRLTLAPSQAPIGYITNPNGFSAVVYSDQGMVMNIVGGKGRIPLPEGSWRLASYTMDQFAVPPRTKAPARPSKAKKLAGKDSPPGILAAPTATAMVRGVILRAEGTAQSPSVQVRKDEVVPMPFGPAYKAVVTSQREQGRTGMVRLSLLLTGSGNERCTSIMLPNGSRPTPPAFSIVDSRGNMVEHGQFEFG